MILALAQLNPVIGDIKGNLKKIVAALGDARKKGAKIILFSELVLCGYPPEDFLWLPHFIDACDKALDEIAPHTKGIAAIVGTLRRNLNGKENPLFNSAAVFTDGKLTGYQDKTLLPNYDIYSERRYFEPAHETNVFNLFGKTVGITICEDIWQHKEITTFTSYRRDPVADLIKKNPDFVVNLSASPYSTSKYSDRLTVAKAAATRLKKPFVLCNQIGGNDSLIFDGRSLYVDGKGQLLKMARGFEEDIMTVHLGSSYDPLTITPHPIEELFEALVLGLKDYFRKSGFQKACLGLSGGIDSAVAACIAKEALGKEHVLAVSMPSSFSSEESIKDARALAMNLGIDYTEIPIKGPYDAFNEILRPSFGNLPFNVAEENLQPRIRATILMALSNKLGYIVLSTGNKSEMALGYATLYGDLCGGLGVLSDVTKKYVYELAEWINRSEEVIPKNTLLKPPSAELRPNQKDSDTLPPYEFIDVVIKQYIEEHILPEEIAKKNGFDLALVNQLVKMIHKNEYKRRQSPPGLRVSERAFSVGRRFPIVQGWV